MWNTKCLNFFWIKRQKYYFFRDYSLLLSEAKYKAKYGRGLRILSPKQLLQRLSIGLAQVKQCRTSENLLNEIRQIIYSLHWTKKLLKGYVII